MTPSAPVTVLGLGPMGQALATTLVNTGHPTSVWNRTPAKADALISLGARRADTVPAAVEASPLVLVCVLDYDAARAILSSATAALRGRTVVNLTADTPERARQMAAWAEEHHITYLDGAIMTPAPTIGGPDARILYSGPAESHEAHQRTLADLGGTHTYLGADPGRAAAHDVALLDVFWTAMSGIVHAFALARAEDITATELAPYAQGVAGLLPGLISTFSEQIDRETYPGDLSSLESAAAGMRHIVDASRAARLDTGVLDAALRVAGQAIERGHAADSFARLVDSWAEHADRARAIAAAGADRRSMNRCGNLAKKSKPRGRPRHG